MTAAQDRKALLTAAIAAVNAARAACEAAGLDGDAGWGTQATPAMLDAVRDRAQSSLDLLVVAETPIAIGDAVRVSDGRGGWTAARLKSVGSRWIGVGRDRYGVDDGCRERWSQYRIHPHDLARIKRWLAKPAEVKP